MYSNNKITNLIKSVVNGEKTEQCAKLLLTENLNLLPQRGFSVIGYFSLFVASMLTKVTNTI